MPQSKIILAGRKARRAGARVGWRRRSESNRCIEVLQTSALPLGYAAGPRTLIDAVAENSTGGEGGCQSCPGRRPGHGLSLPERVRAGPPPGAGPRIGAGNGSRTRDFNLGKVALY